MTVSGHCVISMSRYVHRFNSNHGYVYLSVRRVSAVWSRADVVRSRIRCRRRLTSILSHSPFKAHVPGNSRRHSVECFPRICHSTSYLHAVFRLVAVASVETARSWTARTQSRLTLTCQSRNCRPVNCSNCEVAVTRSWRHSSFVSMSVSCSPRSRITNRSRIVVKS